MSELPDGQRMLETVFLMETKIIESPLQNRRFSGNIIQVER